MTHSSEHPSPRILVVDDNTDAADTLGLLLSHLGCEVRTAYSGSEALACGETFRPQLVLLDIGMPGMDGCETARRMRALDWGQSVVIVALTAWSDEPTRRRVVLAGMNHHEIKPLSLSRAREMVAALHC